MYICIPISSSISLEVLHYACIPDDYSRSFNIYTYKNLDKFIFLFFSCSKSLGTLYILYGLYMNFILEIQKEQKNSAENSQATWKMNIKT